MALVVFLNLVAVVALVYQCMTHGFSRTLPLAAFFFVVFPDECKLQIPGLFDLTPQRIQIITLLLLTATAKTPRRVVALSGAMVTLAAWWLLSAAVSVVFLASLKSVLSQVLDYFVVYYLFARYISSTEAIKDVLFGIVAGLTVCSVFGVIEAYAQWTVLSIFPAVAHRFTVSGGLYLDKARGLRVQSTYAHPILFGSALAMTIPIALYLARVSKSTVRKMVIWVGLLLMFACIFKTASRGPWMALGGACAILFAFCWRGVGRNIAMVGALALAVMIVRPGVWETIANHYLTTVDGHSYEAESYLYRYELYRLAGQELARSPLRAVLGYGPQSFPTLGLVGTINGRTMAFASCDSSISALLIETGYVGLAIATFLFGSAFVRMVRDYLSLSWPDSEICVIFAVNLFVFLFEMTNVAILGWGQQNFILWVVIALAMSYPALLRQEQAGGTQNRTQDTANSKYSWSETHFGRLLLETGSTGAGGAQWLR
ncbi:MAG: O-antigen ligase family protein [Bryobacteraceae bacterium]